MLRTPVAIAVALAALLTFGEVSNWRASRRRLGIGGRIVSSEAIVVLGYRNRGDQANYLNRHRVRAGLRSIDPAVRESVLVFCGGAVGGAVPEAVLMEDYARRTLGYAGPSELDQTSRSTRENIRNAIPLIESADAIKIVSDSLHAEKGRAYLWMLRPDLAARLVRASDYRLGELIWLKPFAAMLGPKNLRWAALRRAERGAHATPPRRIQCL